MKTYLVTTGKTLVATLAENKNDAYQKVKASKGSALKSSILVSSCHIDYVSFEKI